jgi:hypothetical protein
VPGKAIRCKQRREVENPCLLGLPHRPVANQRPEAPGQILDVIFATGVAKSNPPPTALAGTEPVPFGVREVLAGAGELEEVTGDGRARHPDGESNWLEGVQVLVAYAILAHV